MQVEDPEDASLLPARGVQGGGAQPGTPTLPGAPASARQKPDFLLWVCRVFNGITAVAALLCAIAFGIALALQESESAVKGLYEYAGQALRVFGIGISILIMLVETEWQVFLHLVPLLDSWFGRGVLQVFEALLTYREAIAPGDSDLHKSLKLYRSAASGTLLCCACIYMLGAMLCLGAIRKARYRREESLLKAQHDLEALERQRAELQRVLGRAAQD